MNHKKLVLGVLAHVDAGKTTLSESILYLSGSIRKLGRVDHKDAFLDTNDMERARGITIFSKQAGFTLGDIDITLLDTPGHIDFSGEMERTLQVLDYAVLIVSGTDGIQGHTLTLWKLLKHYHIPVFIFINKMDQSGTDENNLIKELTSRLCEGCINVSSQNQEAFFESLAMCDEEVLEHYIDKGTIDSEEIKRLIIERKVFPCCFGSALKLTGVLEFLQILEKYISIPDYKEEFGARIFKITRDKQGSRLTHMKITGGSLKVKDFLTNSNEADKNDSWQEKVDQIRIYSGEKYTAHDEAPAGTVCAVTGLTRTYSGERLGIESASAGPLLEPFLTYQILLPEGVDAFGMLKKLRQLEEEEPLLRILWDEQHGEIHAQVMGEVEIEILTSIIKTRFGVTAEFGFGSLLYKETIKNPVIGVGHFEPLRHYAEVHLLMEPRETGSGLSFGTDCSVDLLGRNWQNLVLTHLEEKNHKGVLTGSEITDMKITLIAGKSHLKHTEGGDFRQAVYRAVRHGLKKAESLLLEPIYEFRLEVPMEMTGRALSDIQKMNGSCQAPEIIGEISMGNGISTPLYLITGSAPVSSMRDYQMEVTAYSRGHGKLSLTPGGYEPCHNTEEIIALKGYDFENDFENPAGSVFCSHGAGFTVSWQDVEKYMHLDIGYRLAGEEKKAVSKAALIPPDKKISQSLQEEKELEQIFIRTYGESKRDRDLFKKNPDRTDKKRISNSIRNNKDEDTNNAGISNNREINKENNKASSIENNKAADIGNSRNANIDTINRSLSGNEKSSDKSRNQNIKEKYLLVDGYNIIFAWKDLNELANENLDSARYRLMDILCGYQGFTDITVIVVFDAYKVKGNPGNIDKYNNIYVVYTKEAETADQYIEKTVHKIGRKHDVTVATSDALEQMIIWGGGASRMSAAGLMETINAADKEIKSSLSVPQKNTKNYPFQNLSEIH